MALEALQRGFADPRGVGFAWTALLAFAACLLVTVLVSLATTPRPEAELAGLVYSLTPRPRMRPVWWKRPEALAVAILLAAIAVNLLLA